MSDPNAAPREEPAAETKPAGATPPAPVSDAPPREERRTRALISLGVGLTLSGIALSVVDDSIARFMVIIGVVMAFVALHRYGRLGPQAV